jgi:hypothetical protein
MPFPCYFLISSFLGVSWSLVLDRAAGPLLKKGLWCRRPWPWCAKPSDWGLEPSAKASGCKNGGQCAYQR